MGTYTVCENRPDICVGTYLLLPEVSILLHSDFEVGEVLLRLDRAKLNIARENTRVVATELNKLKEPHHWATLFLLPPQREPL